MGIRVSKYLVFLVASGALLSSAQDASDKFYTSIRGNDLASIRLLSKSESVNAKDKRETTPLMYAAAYGSVDAMKILIDAGADVNAKNAFDATALHWCSGDLDKVRLLVSKGADVNAKSKPGRTPLLIASAHSGGSAVVKFLLDKGADLSARDQFQSTPLLLATDANDTATIMLLLQKGADINAKDRAGTTPLMNAAAYNNTEVVKLLLARHADVNVVGEAGGPQVKNGPIALGSFTALLLASTYSGPETIKLLLDAGAAVNVQDMRGMTPLTFAISSDRVDIRVVRMLLAKGADPKIKSKDGEDSFAWARKFQNPAVMEALGMERKQASSVVFRTAGDEKLKTPREAAQKGLAVLQGTSGKFFQEGGCVSCHAQNLTGMAISAARANGIPVDEKAAAEQLRVARLQWSAFEQPLLQRMDPPGTMDVQMYTVLHFSTEGVPAERVLDPMIHNIAGEQRKEGNWSATGVARAPMEDGDFSRTAICLKALAAYGMPGRKPEFDQRIARAAAWLKSNRPRSTEDRDMQLLGLKWAHVDYKAPLKELMAMQRSDGGWSQTADLSSDAYATGQVLYTMHETGVSSGDPAYRRGVEFLLKTQLDDGTWHVSSRSPKFQPYFQSGFPHDHDQWISSAASAWAIMALSYAAPDKHLALK